MVPVPRTSRVKELIRSGTLLTVDCTWSNLKGTLSYTRLNFYVLQMLLDKMEKKSILFVSSKGKKKYLFMYASYGFPVQMSW
jgi:hypothetical protein